MKQLALSLLGTVAVIYMILLTVLSATVIFATPLTYAIQPFTLDKGHYVTGDSMIVTSYRCNNESSPLVVGTVERYFFNLETGERFDIPGGTGIAQVGCSWQDSQVLNAFPPSMPSGPYILQGLTRADGKWRTVYIPWQTAAFQYKRTG